MPTENKLPSKIVRLLLAANVVLFVAAVVGLAASLYLKSYVVTAAMLLVVALTAVNIRQFWRQIREG